MSVSTRCPLSTGPHLIEVDGIAQRYHVRGGGPVCVVHPGGPGLGWEYLRMPELERHLTLVYLEPIGTGGSGRLAEPTNYRLDVYARFVLGVLEHLGPDPVLLLGHAHGGFVAQIFALEHPDRLTGLILYDTSPLVGREFEADAMVNLASFEEHFADRAEAAEMKWNLLGAATAVDDEGFTQALRAFLPACVFDYWSHEAELAPLRAGLRAWIDPLRGAEQVPYDLRDRLGDIDLPTLIIVGVRDLLFGARWARLLRQRIPGAELIFLNARGHLGHLEEPEMFVPAVVEFGRRCWGRTEVRTG